MLQQYHRQEKHQYANQTIIHPNNLSTSEAHSSNLICLRYTFTEQIVKEVILSQTSGPAGLSGSAQNLSKALPVGVSSSANGVINSKSQPQAAAPIATYNKKIPSSLVNSASSLKSQLPFVGWTADNNRKAVSVNFMS